MMYYNARDEEELVHVSKEVKALKDALDHWRAKLLLRYAGKVHPTKFHSTVERHHFFVSCLPAELGLPTIVEEKEIQ